jgi:hypothetical protein
MNEEGTCVLEVITIDRLSQDAAGWDGCTSLGDDEREFTLGDTDHGHFLNVILHDPEAKV